MDIFESFQQVRLQSEQLCAPLEIEDYVIQSMPDVSPVKWHLAHTSWFFEQMVLKVADPGYKAFSDAFSFCFQFLL